MAGYADEGYPQGHPVVSAPPMGPRHWPTWLALGVMVLANISGRSLTDPFFEPVWAEIDRLRDLFKFEFFYQPREAFHRELEAELDRVHTFLGLP